jgi:putative tricarboxylic transport membrane protein
LGAKRDWGQAAFGAGVCLAGVGLGWHAFEIPVRPVDVLLGPRLFPLAVMAGVAALGAALVVAALRAHPAPVVEDRGGSIDWRALGYILGGLGLFAVAVETLGFAVATALLFVAVARGFGSANLWRDAGIGVVLSGTVFAVFVYGLGLDLPGPASWLRP